MSKVPPDRIRRVVPGGDAVGVRGEGRARLALAGGSRRAASARWFCDYEMRLTVRVPQTPWNA